MTYHSAYYRSPWFAGFEDDDEIEEIEPSLTIVELEALGQIPLPLIAPRQCPELRRTRQMKELSL